jgi:hypothetical protein
MALLGLILTFMPDEVLRFSSIVPTAIVLLLAQVCGALYVGFAMLNWIARANLIGGIYSRPVVIGNLLHFTMVALVLIRSIVNGQRGNLFVIGLCCYAVFAVWFGRVLFAHPLKTQTD